MQSSTLPLLALHCILVNFLSSSEELRGELLGIAVMSSEEGGGDTSSLGAELVAVGFLHFHDQSVGTHQGEKASHGRRLSLLLLGIVGVAEVLFA